jgi:hypothetical protein
LSTPESTLENINDPSGSIATLGKFAVALLIHTRTADSVTPGGAITLPRTATPIPDTISKSRLRTIAPLVTLMAVAPVCADTPG